ncbi:MAG: hypothetical protein R6U52_01580 [Kosmotogaceae bacterium]
MSSSGTNRPFKYGANDRREFIVQDSEVAIRAVNDANGNPTYLGRAKAGTLTSESKWQIRKITYDANQGVTAVEWPESGGIASPDFIFEWDDVLTYTYS